MHLKESGERGGAFHNHPGLWCQLGRASGSHCHFQSPTYPHFPLLRGHGIERRNFPQFWVRQVLSQVLRPWVVSFLQGHWQDTHSLLSTRASPGLRWGWHLGTASVSPVFSGAGKNDPHSSRDFRYNLVYFLEKAMAPHSSTLAWRIPGTGEPGGLPSMGSHRVGHDWSDLAAAAAAVYFFSFSCPSWP